MDNVLCLDLNLRGEVPETNFLAPKNATRAPNFSFWEPKGLPKIYLRQQPCMNLLGFCPRIVVEFIKDCLCEFRLNYYMYLSKTKLCLS